MWQNLKFNLPIDNFVQQWYNKTKDRKEKEMGEMTHLELLELEYKHAFELMKEKNEEYKKARKYFYDVSMALFEEYQKIIWPEEK